MKYRFSFLMLMATVLITGSALAQTSTEYNNQGLAKFNARNYEAALQDLNKAVALDPRNEKALHNRGLTKYALKDYDGAIKDHSSAIALNAAYSNAYNDRGAVYNKLNNYVAALSDFSKAIQLDPAYFRAYKSRASVNYALKNYDAADNDYAKCIELQPNDDDGYLGRGSIQSLKNNHAAAIKFYDKALQFQPNSATALLNRGNAKYALKDVNGALADFLKVIQVQPGNANVYFNLGSIYMTQGKSMDAINAFKKYNAYLPNEWMGYKYTADVYYIQLEQYDYAELYYNKAYQLNKNDKTIIERLGYSMLNQKKIGEAIGMFKSQIAMLPNDYWGYYNLGAAYSVGKSHPEALKNLDIALTKRMVELEHWESDRNLDNVRFLDDFKKMLEKYFNKDILAKYPGLRGVL